MADGKLAVQNAYLAYHLVRRNLVNNNVDVSSLPTTALSHPALEEETFKRAVCILEKANDHAAALTHLDISDTCLHSEFSKLANAVLRDEIRWGRIASLFFRTSLLALKLIREGRGAAVNSLVSRLVQLLDDSVAHWITKEGGWCRLKCDIIPARLLVEESEHREYLNRVLAGAVIAGAVIAGAVVVLFLGGLDLLCWLFTLGTIRAGFKNLLLDGWWLEFWEIILLAAGDVERNPGPRRMTDKELSNVDGQVLGKDDFFDVYNAVFDCRAKWNNLCLALRISPGDLSAVEEKRHGDVVACLRDGLSLWLQGCYNKVKYGPPTWRMLVDAVANSAGGDDHSLALEIAKEHRALPDVQIAISRCDDCRSSEEMGTASFGDAHKATHAQSAMKPVEDDCAREDSRRGHQHSAAFSKMYGAITRGIGRSLDVDDLRQFLCFFTDPDSLNHQYIQPSLYIGVETTREILHHLYPEYINPKNIYLLEEIISLSNSRQCKRLLDEYIRKYPH